MRTHTNTKSDTIHDNIKNRADGDQMIHLLNPFGNAAGGSEWRTIELYKELCVYSPVTLWSEHDPVPEFKENWPIRRVDPGTGEFPRGGTLVIIGVYFRVGSWVRNSKPRRIIIVYNTFSRDRLLKMHHALEQLGFKSIEIVFASDLLRRSVDLPGIVQPSLIDLNRFNVRPRPDNELFTVGRMSRDVAEKHHPHDVHIYQRLAAFGCRIMIMGGTCLREQYARFNDGNIELLPPNVLSAENFLRGLDCFFYRTGKWLEPSARVVAEAMACGVPVVCHDRGGHTELIRHGQNGFLFDTDDEAVELILSLRSDPELRTYISRAARQSMEQLFSPANRRALADYYLGK